MGDPLRRGNATRQRANVPSKQREARSMASEVDAMKTFTVRGRRYAWRPEVLEANLRAIGYIAAAVIAPAIIYVLMLSFAALAA